MGISLLRATGRLLAPVVAVALLAGVSQEAGAYGSEGRIAFQTGKLLSSFEFTLETSNSGSWPSDSFGTLGEQGFRVDKNCTVVTPSDVITDGTDELVDVVALRNGSGASLGYSATSLGVYDGPQGIACGRISADKNEAIEFAIGADTKSRTSANAFDRLEFDFEVKGDVEVQVDVLFDGSMRSYFLYAGSGLVTTPDDEGTELNPDDTDFYCSAASDAGPDSGPSDNCRLIINDVGQSFRISVNSGDVSLEGGGDFVNPLPKRSFIYLTQADGILDCGDEAAATGEGTISCAITRVDPELGACVPVPYVFRRSGGTCTLTVDPGVQQFVANLFIDYPEEAAPNGTLSVDTDQVWPDVALSRVAFTQTPANESHPIPACLGTTLDFEETGGQSLGGGPQPIPQIAGGMYDWIGGNGTIEYACAFLRNERLETVDGALKLFIYEGIQFWGDISFSRGGSN